MTKGNQTFNSCLQWQWLSCQATSINPHRLKARSKKGTLFAQQPFRSFPVSRIEKIHLPSLCPSYCRLVFFFSSTALLYVSQQSHNLLSLHFFSLLYLTRVLASPLSLPTLRVYLIVSQFTLVNVARQVKEKMYLVLILR